MRRGELVYWLVGSVLLGWLLNPLAHGQVVWQSVTPTQCYGCCPPQSCQPRSLPYVSPQRPQPDGQYTQPAPQFQPLPSPPQPTTPALPQSQQSQQPQPAFNCDEYDKRQQKLLEAITANKCQCKPCDCKPTDLTGVESRLTANAEAIAKLAVAIDGLKPSVPTPAPAPVAPPAQKYFYDIVPRSQGAK